MSDVSLHCKMIPQNCQNCLPQTSVLLFSDCLIPFCTLENLQKLQNGHTQHICCSRWYGEHPIISTAVKKMLCPKTAVFFWKKNHLPNSTTSISQVSNALHLHASSFPIHFPHRLHTWIHDAEFDVGDTRCYLPPQRWRHKLEKNNIHPWNLRWNLKRSPWKKEIPFGNHHFQVPLLNFGGVHNKKGSQLPSPNYLSKESCSDKKKVMSVATLKIESSPLIWRLECEFWNVATGKRQINVESTSQHEKPTYASPRRWH